MLLIRIKCIHIDTQQCIFNCYPRGGMPARCLSIVHGSLGSTAKPIIRLHVDCAGSLSVLMYSEP